MFQEQVIKIVINCVRIYDIITIEHLGGVHINSISTAYTPISVGMNQGSKYHFKLLEHFKA